MISKTLQGKDIKGGFVVITWLFRNDPKTNHPWNSQRASIGLNVEVGSAGGGGNVEYETNVEGREYVRSHIKREYDFPCHIPREVCISIKKWYWPYLTMIYLIRWPLMTELIVKWLT